MPIVDGRVTKRRVQKVPYTRVSGLPEKAQQELERNFDLVQDHGMPTGAIVAWGALDVAQGGDPAPQGWLVCDGLAYLKSEYPRLWQVLQGEFGSTSTAFNVPNLQGRMIVGLNTGDPIMDDTGETGGTKNAITVSHNHNGDTLPAGSFNVSHSAVGNANTGINGNNHHHVGLNILGIGSASHTHYVGGPPGFMGTGPNGGVGSNARTAGISANHVHNNNAGHSHSNHSVSSHVHLIETSGSAGTNQNMPPFMAIRFIIKAV